MSVSGFYLEKGNNNRIRLDVDGTYSQNVVSGVIYTNGGKDLFYWFVRKCIWDFKTNKGEGEVKYVFNNDKLGNPATWYKKINFELNASTNELKVTQSGNNLPTKTLIYKFSVANFQEVRMEFDYQKGFTPVLSVRPKAIFKPNEIPTDAEFKALPDLLTIEEVFKRTGFNLYRTGKDNEVTINVPAGTNPMDYQWKNTELHDVMQKQWSQIADTSNMMSLWAFITTRISDAAVAGRMFDSNNNGVNADTNKKPRQGCAIFYKHSSFIDNGTWNDTIKFISTVHEIGHCFNLFHSDSKKASGNSSIPSKPCYPWIPDEMVDTIKTKSFMNYAYDYQNATGTNFYKDFRYRFSDQEIFFMRHAPKWFIKMGEYDWGFSHASVGDFELSVKVDKQKAVYNFLEPVIVEVQLKNSSSETKKVDRSALKNTEHFGLYIKKENGQEVSMIRPFHRDCIIPMDIELKPGETLTETHFVSADVTGWKITDAGNYSIRAIADVNEDEIASNVLEVRVLSPNERDEDIIAQDYFSDGVARVLYYGGSKFLKKENDLLREVVERFGKGNPETAVHAQMALLLPDSDYFNEANISKGAPLSFTLHEPKAETIQQMHELLTGNSKLAAQTLTAKNHHAYEQLAIGQMKLLARVK